MKKIIKNVIIVAIIFSLLSTVIFTGISYTTEPHSWIPFDTGDYNFAEKTYKNLRGFWTFFNRYNYTESQGDFSIGFYSGLIGNTTGAQLQSYYWGELTPFQFSVCILYDNLSFPYNAMSLEIGKTTLSSSGPILMNVSAYNNSNILTALKPLYYYYGGTPGNYGGYKNPNSVSGPIGSYGVDYNIYTGYNYTNVTKHYMRAGNYSMNFTFNFTPIFEFGPYYVTGNQLNISFAWRWTILPTPQYVPPKFL